MDHGDPKTALSTQQSQATCRINEIFFSIQGESTKTGLPTIFIRLTGCPLRCRYCDTTYAFHKGEKMSLDAILQNISQYRTQHVTVTGGEPLAQQTCHELLTRLCDEGYQVSLETSGAIDIANVECRVMKIMDIKTPGSGEETKNNFANLAHITMQDQIKFVIADRGDYDWSKQKITEFNMLDLCEVLFSPAHDTLNATMLAGWILADNLHVRLQIQLHKYLWGNVPGK